MDSKFPTPSTPSKINSPVKNKLYKMVKGWEEYLEVASYIVEQSKKE